ncbi:MAG: DUF222 domain-containing protein [Acidimicrobiales bacterium]
MDSAAEPGFANEALGARVAAAVAAVEALAAELAQPQQAGDALLVEHRLEHLHRLVGAAQIDNVTAIDTGRLHRIDGHRSVKAHIAHVLKVSPAEAGRRAQAARALRDLPDIAAALRAGRVSLCHVQLLARVQANPRITGKVPGRQEKFLRWAAEESFDRFKDKVLDWERATDMNGGFHDNERNHANRNVRLIHASIDNTWELSGHFAADQGARMREILDHYTHMLWQADWAAARAKLGEAATVSDLKRTDAQRRADALERIFNDAAGAPADTSRPAIVHNIVWSADTYLALADLLGADAAALDTHWSASLTDATVQRDQWCDPDTYRCSTLDGVPLEPVEQFFSSLANHVRRVIVNTKGVVIDLGRKARLFTGSARLAAQLQSPRCIWPGCDHPTTRCEIDHLLDHARGGPTNPDNGAPLCGFHNRWKQKGFATTRDPVTGRWRTYRPDGSVIQ